MVNKFINWLKSIGSKSSNNATPTSGSMHVVLTRQQVIDAIIKALKPLNGADSLNAILLWVSDAVLLQTVHGEGFMQELRTAFDNAGFYSIGSGRIGVREGACATNGAHTTICPGLELTFGETTAPSQTDGKQLRITVVEGTGSTEQSSYILDGVTKQRFCIGRGNIAHHSNLYRVNDVVIRTDDPDITIQKRNNCVSSAHANIVISDGGFFLQVEVGGCRNMGGSATKVFRNQRATEITDLKTLYRLHDGDILELGKEVLLTISITS
ncbi:MAG: hypothetical protein K6B13_13120 [Prevotella sp.]|nr:hypothetical protein [Prevotella sp.]